MVVILSALGFWLGEDAGMLVDGLSRIKAAEQTNLKGPSVSGVVRRFKDADALMKNAYSEAKGGSGQGCSEESK